MFWKVEMEVRVVWSFVTEKRIGALVSAIKEMVETHLENDPPEAGEGTASWWVKCRLTGARPSIPLSSTLYFPSCSHSDFWKQTSDCDTSLLKISNWLLTTYSKIQVWMLDSRILQIQTPGNFVSCPFVPRTLCCRHRGSLAGHWSCQTYPTSASTFALSGSSVPAGHFPATPQGCFYLWMDDPALCPVSERLFWATLS